MLSIRSAQKEDALTILQLVRELAAFEKEPDAVVASTDDFIRDGFGEHPAFKVLIGEWEGTPVSFAFYFFAYSTWRGRRVLYLEDLFVRPAFRQRGIGQSLMKRLAQIAVAEDCARFVWQVLDWNESAIRFYERLGASIQREWLTVRLEGASLKALAQSAT